MASGARCYGDDAVRAFLDRLSRKTIVDHVMQSVPAPRMNRIVELNPCAKRGNDDRHLPLRADLHIVVEAVVRTMHDLVDREWRRRSLGMIAVPRGERFGAFVNPFAEQRCRPSVQRGEAADDARRALRNHEFRARHDEHRRADHRDSQLWQDRRKGQRPWYSRYQRTKRGMPSSMLVAGSNP